MNEYITEALSAIRGSDPDRAQAYALVSIAESLAVLAGDLREERLRSESLRGALAEARAEADESAALVDRVWKIINGDGTDIARIAAIHEAVTE